MRLPRFRVRTLMIVVGVVALLFGGAPMATRWFDYDHLARTYEADERRWREMAAREPGDPRSIAATYGPQVVEEYARLARKYRRAMWRPWASVSPDPPYFYPAKRP
jgi:hypothetical protein